MSVSAPGNAAIGEQFGVAGRFVENGGDKLLIARRRVRYGFKQAHQHQFQRHQVRPLLLQLRRKAPVACPLCDPPWFTYERFASSLNNRSLSATCFASVACSRLRNILAALASWPPRSSVAIIRP